MVQGVVAAALCLLLLALAHQGGASRPGRSMVGLGLAEENTVAQLRFEAGDTACARFGSVYRCGDASLSIPTPGTLVPQDIPVMEGSPVLFENYRPDRSDCGPLGKHKYRCDPPMETRAPVEVASVVVADSSAEAFHLERSDCGPLGKRKYRCDPPIETGAPVEVAVVVVDSSAEAEAYPSERSDCGPLGKHKYRCVPPLKTTAPVEVASALVDSSAEGDAYPSERSDCGPLGKHKYRCDPPLH